MPQQIKRKILKYFRIITPLMFVAVVIFVVVVSFWLLKPLYNFCQENNLNWSFIIALVNDSKPNIKQYQDRTNIVLLGIGDKIHEGYDLTDTIMFISVNFQDKDVVIVSVPRDIYLPSLKDRINTAYHYGEEKKAGGGILMSKAAVEELVGKPIHFAWMIDFSGFKKIIDLMGGIDVNVEREFTDSMFPIPGKENDLCAGDPTFACRYEKLHFEKGLQHMDGETALKFVRSRYAQGEEGTDFARSRRQQQVMVGLKDKLIASRFWLNPKLVKTLLDNYKQLITTNMNLSEQILLAKYFLFLPDGKIRKISLDTGNDKKGIKGLLVNPPLWQYNGAWVLIPRTGNFGEIQSYLACFIENPNCEMKL